MKTIAAYYGRAMEWAQTYSSIRLIRGGRPFAQVRRGHGLLMQELVFCVGAGHACEWFYSCAGLDRGRGPLVQMLAGFLESAGLISYGYSSAVAPHHCLNTYQTRCAFVYRTTSTKNLSLLAAKRRGRLESVTALARYQSRCRQHFVHESPRLACPASARHASKT